MKLMATHRRFWQLGFHALQDSQFSTKHFTFLERKVHEVDEVYSQQVERHLDKRTQTWTSWCALYITRDFQESDFDLCKHSTGCGGEIKVLNQEEFLYIHNRVEAATNALEK